MTMSKEEAINKLNQFAHNVIGDTIIGDLVIDSLEHFRSQANSDYGFHNLSDYKTICESLRHENMSLQSRNTALHNTFQQLQTEENRIEKRLCNLREQAEEMRDTLNNVIQSI